MPLICQIEQWQDQEHASRVVAILAAFEMTRAKIGNVNPVTSFLRREIESAGDDTAWDALAARIREDGTLA